jgi:23S rRNA (guanosine2251-2'-O)-methyltransferase
MEQLEGRQSVLAALDARQRRFEIILVSHQAHAEKVQDVLDLAAKRGVPVKRVDSRELSAMSHGKTHGGVVAVVSPKPRLAGGDLPELLAALERPPLLLLLEGIDDARNLGFTLRTADALGADAVLVKKHLWDFDSADVARSSSGAFERLPLVQIDAVEPLAALQRQGLKLIGCIAGTRRTIHEADLTAGTILAIGGEKRGLSAAVRSLCDQNVRIPTARPHSSLALSHAAAIVLAEAARQRASVIGRGGICPGQSTVAE